MKLIMKFCVVIAILSFDTSAMAQNSSPQVDNCVRDDEAADKYFSERKDISKRIVYDWYFMPAWAKVDLGLVQKFDQTEQFFAFIRFDDKTGFSLKKDAINTHEASGKDELVANELIKNGDSILTLRIPRKAGRFWKLANIYVYNCVDGKPSKISDIVARISSKFYNAVIVLLY
jgi:hypothetical protein